MIAIAIYALLSSINAIVRSEFLAMGYQDQISSVALIADHIKESLTDAIKDLEQYHQSSESSSLRRQAWDKIYLLNRVFAFIELQGADSLSKELCNRIKNLSEPFNEEDEQRLETIIYCLTVLERYVDFIVSKPFDLPQLLFPTINELRATFNMPLLPESVLFKANHRKVREPSDNQQRLDDYDVVKTSRRLRQMYQIGLIEVIRKTNVSGGLAMIQRALTRLDSQCGFPDAPNLWWIASAAINGCIDGGLILEPQRIKLLSRLDLQIRELGQLNRNINYKNREKAEQLAFELLYLVSLSDADDIVSEEVRAHFELENKGLTERNLIQEFSILKGLKQDDYATLFTTILDDILLLQTNLIADEFESGSEELQQLHHQLKQFHSLFSVLEYQSLEIQLREAFERVELIISKETSLDDDTRQFVSQVLDKIEYQLNDILSKGNVNESNLARTSLSVEQISAGQDARKQLQIVIQQLENYSKKEHDPQLLSGMPGSLRRAKDSMSSLDIKDFESLLDSLTEISDAYFTKQPATLQALELFADILCSVDFYLETLINYHQPSNKIFQFADENLARLNAYLQL